MFMLAQVLGAFCGAGIIYANYYHAIDLFEGGHGIRTLSTASLFATYAVRLVLCHLSIFLIDVPVALHDIDLMLLLGIHGYRCVAHGCYGRYRQEARTSTQPRSFGALHYHFGQRCGPWYGDVLRCQSCP